MPIITLLTDYGTADSYVGELKGVLLTQAPGVTLVDLTHQVAPGDVAAAAYVLARAWHRFPPGTVHLAVVDPGVGTARSALALRTREHLFVGPDNGLFSGLLRAAEIGPSACRRRPSPLPRSTGGISSRRRPQRWPGASRSRAWAKGTPRSPAA